MLTPAEPPGAPQAKQGGGGGGKQGTGGGGGWAGPGRGLFSQPFHLRPEASADWLISTMNLQVDPKP